MIEVRELTKIYGQHTAVDNISFSIKAGEIVGFLGPNGAGKTTTMNIMTGYIASTHGEVTINGIDVLAEPELAKANIGYLPDTPPVYGDMKVDEFLYFVSDLKKVKSRDKWPQINAAKAAVRIEDMSKRLIKNLSRGYRQRVGLAQAMIGRPSVIIMDEPTIGLDPRQIIEMREVITNLGKKHTVMLSSHIMQEVSAVCDRVMIIHRGKIIASDTPERLAAGLAPPNRMHVRIRGDQHQAVIALREYPVIRHVNVDEIREPGTIDLILHGDEGTDIREPIFRCMMKHNIPILMMKTIDISLEDVFLTLTGSIRMDSAGYEQPGYVAEAAKTAESGATNASESATDENKTPADSEAEASETNNEDASGNETENSETNNEPSESPTQKEAE